MINITVQEIMNRPHFSNVTIVAGKTCLTRSFRWAHVIEKTDCGHLINGGELILSTGIKWNQDKNTSLFYLKQLLENDAAALCIELDKNAIPLSTEFLELADTHGFPVILFNEEVKFVEITQDLHEYVLGFQYSVWQELDNMYNKLDHALISNKNINDFLKILHQTVNKQVSFYQFNGNFWCFPIIESTEKSKLKEVLADYQEPENSNAQMPSHFIKHQFGILFYKNQTNEFTEFEKLALERCSTFISKYLAITYQHIERRQIEKSEWITSIVTKSMNHDQVVSHIRNSSNNVKLNESCIGLIPFNKEENDEFFLKKSLSNILLSIREFFNSNGFHLLGTTDHDHGQFILLLINQGESADLTIRLENSIDQIKTFHKNEDNHEQLNLISIGTIVKDYGRLQHSFHMANKTLNIQNNIKKTDVSLYKNLNLYRILENMENNTEIQDIIRDYLGPLLDYDKDNKTDLLHTLMVYLKNRHSKKTAAAELFIIRQTLYHRINKINSIIHFDLKVPQHRLMYEFAIYAYNYKYSMT